MLTNSSLGKLKASKSSAELNQSLGEGNRKIGIFDKGGEGDRENGASHYSNIHGTSLSTKIYSSRDRTDSRVKPRPLRSRDDLQMPQGSSVDRRVTNVRGRGGGFSRKVERESDSSNASRGKFQESLIKGSTSDLTLSSSKYYESESSKSRMDHAFNVPEDSRISKLLRRLSREDDLEKFLALCQQLQDSLSAPDNARYIRRAFDDITNSIVGALHRAPGPEAKAQVALCLGRLGYVLIDQDFKRFMDWLFGQYDAERSDVKMSLLKAVHETVRLDKEAPALKESCLLMAQLQTTLENTDLPELIMATVDVIVAVSESYPNTFTKHFRDTVDILVGWHIDGTKSPKVLYYASRSLQKLTRYWIGDMHFSTTLLAQFLEDMEAYGEDFNQSGRSTPAPEDDAAPPTAETTAVRVAALVKVFNTVAKSLGQHLNPATSTSVTYTFLVDCLAKLLRTVTKALGLVMDEDLIVAANECAYILLTHLQSKTSPAHASLYGLVYTELDSFATFADATLISMLRIVVKIIREVSGNLTMEFVQTVLSPKSPLLGLRFSPSVAIQNEVLSVFHGLLNLKNIPLLQEAYRHVLGDLDKAYRMIIPSIKELCQSNPYPDTKYENVNDAEMVVLFYLRTLTDLANATNSIIGMWALNPSIFELIARDLKPCEKELSPVLQYSLLYLLHSHCSKSNNFVSSSDFVSAKQDRPVVFGLPASLGSDSRSASPTSGHYAIILDLLSRLVAAETSEETRALVLAWSREVFLHSEKFFDTLYGTGALDGLIRLVVAAGHCTSIEIVSRVAENVEQLLSIGNVKWKPELLRSIVDLCLFHFNSSSLPIRNHVSLLLAMVPWDVAIPTISKALNAISYQKKDITALTFNTLNVVSRQYIARDSCGPMQPQHFRRFMGYLLQGADNKNGWLREMFTSCWPIQTDDRKNKLFGRLSLVSTSVLLLWATWEAAQLCVMQKLRTPLGKPQDTFTSIEGAVKQLAREITLAETKTETKRGPLASEPSRVRSLLEFLEQLEKAMFNAAEGCALAMTQPPKPIRTFFHTNKSTCGEWLTRVRMAVVVVAVRAGMATTAVRHGHCLLQGLVDGNATGGAEFEVAVMHVCWALGQLREPGAITGLYAWCRETSGRKFPWLKAAAHQSSGKYELAAADYRKLLEHASPRSSPVHDDAPRTAPRTDADPQVLGFLSDRLADCYDRLQDWSEMHKWKLREAELWTNQNGGTPLKYVMGAMNAARAKALQEFEEGDYAAASELMTWPTEEDLPDAKKCWNCYRLESQVESTLANVAMNLAAGNGDDERTIKLKDMLEKCSRVTRSFVQFGLRNPPSEFLEKALVLQYVAAGLKEVAEGGRGCRSFDMTEKTCLVGMDASLLTRVLWWSKCFEKIAEQRKEATVSSTCQLQLVVVRAARKEGNLGLAQRLLLKHLEASEHMRIAGKKKISLEEVAKNVMNADVCSGDGTPVWNVQKVAAYTEVAKLLYASENADRAVDVCAFTALAVSARLNADGEGDDPDMRERSARLMMTLAKWLQEKRQGGGESDTENWLFEKLMDQEKSRNHLVAPTVEDGPVAVPPNEAAIGYILQLASARCPDLSKTWSQYATWCYRWGKRMVEAPISTNQMADADKAAVQQLLPRGTTAEEFDAVMSVLSRPLAHDAEDAEGDDLCAVATSDSVKSRLASALRHRATDAQLDELVATWRGSQSRTYGYYRRAAEAYFKYLALSDDAGTSDCNTIIAPLRLLRMMAKHASELQAVLEAGLGSTPVRPWKVIIPQLFSRLSHPEPYVRTRVSELLCRVAQDAPHLITFPAVVGATGGGATLRDSVSASRLFSAGLSQPDEDDEEEEEEEDEEALNNEEEVSVLKTCFLAMVDTLANQAPLAIAQVQLVVSELRRITLLWDELWLGTLVQHHPEVSRRLAQLEAEVRRVDDNTSLGPAERNRLVAEKHRIVMKPLVFILEQLHAITSVQPETPHEVWFQEKFSDYITESLQKLKSPANPRRPHDSWHPFKVMQSRLQHRAQKRSAYAISMSDASPLLAALRDSVIAMPGVAPSRPGQIITIAAVDNTVTVLPTKTKPKKLVFHGSDGQMYTYLFKGLEDLHLDERIMQFLSIANTMLASEPGAGSLYRARHYSVIPLGPRSGLISWVDGVTPLFGLYKRWQQREIAAGSLKGSSSTANQGSGGAQVMRPSEMFYSKLTPMLKEAGVTNLDNRKEWPLPILRQVLTELMEETPKDLLAKELWCHSVNAGGWWRSTRTYSYSVAVMSIIGYIIGLGDRHLDNVLVDLNTGEVVHIDYNVCFEKGKTLRVPEKVPFRMTQNIRTALGVTGVEGIFRLTCEHVLKVMKKGRETLLTLLEAFVYDPLIDWTPGNETGYTGAVYGGGHAVAAEAKQSRKQLEHEVTRAMFCVRATEMRADWCANRDHLLEAVPELERQLARWLEAHATIKTAEESLQDCHQQMALVKEAEAQGLLSQHPLYTLAGRYSTHRHAKDSLAATRAALTDRVDECDRLLAQHGAALAVLRGPALVGWIAEVNYPQVKDAHLVFDLVKEFLLSAGQGPMVGQCEQSETEVGQLAQQQTALIRTCLDRLTQYKAVASLYPASYIATHRAACYRRWAGGLRDNMTPESCLEVRAQFAALFSPEPHATLHVQQQVLACSYQQQAVLNEANVRLQKWYERLTMEGSGDGHAAYLEAKAAISAFPRSEKGAALALECVNVTALCALNKRYIMMETAAFCAGDSLVDLTSREGDWFLDEMYVVSTSITELSGLIPAQHGTDADSRVQLVLQCIQSAHGIYKGLQELNFNFHTIILPEAVERIQGEEPTVIAMVANLNQTIASIGVPLNQLLAQLEKHLRCIIMEMESAHSGAQATVALLSARFKALTRATDTEDTPGMMLLMGFNGLFEKLQKDGCALVAALDTLDTPECWRKIDQVRDAKAISAPVFNDATRGVLEDIFLIRRLQTMQEFFALCCQMALNSTVVHDDERLMKPIRRYTADYVSRRLLGVTSQTLAIALCLLLQRIGLNVTVEVEQRDVGVDSKVSLEELCRKAVDTSLKLGLFGNGVLAQASGLTSGLESSWRRKENARRLQLEVEGRRSTLKRLHYQLTAYHWLHEDSLAVHGPAVNNMILINRSSFMLELRQAFSSLVSLQPRLTEGLKQQAALAASVAQRLKWAAGANPALTEVLAAFESALETRDERLANEQRLAVDVAATCNALVHHEALRTRTTEALANDNAFLQLIDQCEKSCVLAASYDQNVTAVEESLVQLLVPEGSVDHAWIHNVERLISGSVKALQHQMAALQDALRSVQEKVKAKALNVRSLMNVHHKLMADVKNLIKPMMKYEDADLAGLPSYWSTYRAWTEQLAALIRDLTAADLELDTAAVHQVLTQLQVLQSETAAVYKGLLAFGKPWEETRGKRPPLIRQESVCLSPRRGVPVAGGAEGKKTSRDPHTGKAVQERNAYAVNVWKRVRTKFEGRDPDLGRKVSNQEQVDYVIREATNMDNLSLLYEGWTPWV